MLANINLVVITMIILLILEFSLVSNLDFAFLSFGIIHVVQV